MAAQNSNARENLLVACFHAVRGWMARHFALSATFLLLSAAGPTIYATAQAVSPQWTNTIARVEVSFDKVIENRKSFSGAFDLIHQEFGRSEVLPSRDQITIVSTGVRDTLQSLSGLEAPTWRIDRMRRSYRRSLNLLLGAINQYDETPEAYLAAFNAFQVEANAGGGLVDAVEAYTAGGLRSLWGTVF